jgi:predicted component of type VI protein secretion system|tara:strand:+ start:441 stop:680 length:240 start_codon:yes stop_codon:yes gene_type:complete
MNSRIKQTKLGKYTCLDFPERKARLVYNNDTKKYNIYHIPEEPKKQKKESPVWKNATLIVGGMCAGMIIVIGILAIKML